MCITWLKCSKFYFGNCPWKKKCFNTSLFRLVQNCLDYGTSCSTGPQIPLCGTAVEIHVLLFKHGLWFLAIQVREILLEYDSNMCPMSLDEAYLDLTEHVKQRQSYSDGERSFARVLGDDGTPLLCQCSDGGGKTIESNPQPHDAGKEETSGKCCVQYSAVCVLSQTAWG